MGCQNSSGRWSLNGRSLAFPSPSLKFFVHGVGACHLQSVAAEKSSYVPFGCSRLLWPYIGLH